MAMRKIVQKRILIRLTLEVALNVKLGVELRRRVAPFLIAMKDEVLERIDAGRCDVRIDLTIILRVEFRDRAERAQAVLQIVRERALAFRDAVLLPIPGRLKIGTWPPPIALADRRIVQERMLIRLLHIGIGCDVPDRVEDQIWLSTFPVAIEEEMLKRIGADRDHVRIAGRVEILVKKPEALEGARGICKVAGRPARRSLGGEQLRRTVQFCGDRL
ncbi:hypothetical protein [Bradyrhizobium liaoningense]|uniref:hypothetical protein n=1 Tax=Bradyrhizobium liaoningense TaxID=43992 RepID=UPI001FCB17D2|nr:hypothetical protein [Bradyrhizobium liaoningense]